MYCLAMNCDENRSCFGRAAACEGLLEVAAAVAVDGIFYGMPWHG